MTTAPQATRYRNTALVTGASSGIGYELARRFAEAGYDVVLVARSADRLQAVADELEQHHGVTARAMASDLADPAAPERLYAEVQSAGIAVDILVNNAGFGSYGAFAETDLATELQLLQVNVVALTHLTKLFLRDMLRRGHGKILNVASTAAFQPGPLMAVYYASKAYVLSFSEALAVELEGTGVTATVLCPGPTVSDFQRRAAMETTRLVQGPMMMDAATVARIGYEGLMANKTVVIPGFKNTVLALVSRLAPRGMSARIVRQLHERSQRPRSPRAQTAS
jgi:short-subunit dehydrogenase